MDDSFSALASDPAIWNFSIFTWKKNFGLAWKKLWYLRKISLAHSKTELKPQVSLLFTLAPGSPGIPLAPSAPGRPCKNPKGQTFENAVKLVNIYIYLKRNYLPEQHWSICYLPFCQVFHLDPGHLEHHEDPEFKECNS